MAISSDEKWSCRVPCSPNVLAAFQEVARLLRFIFALDSSSDSEFVTTGTSASMLAQGTN